MSIIHRNSIFEDFPGLFKEYKYFFENKKIKYLNLKKKKIIKFKKIKYINLKK
jgi:hypothetical protein